MGKMGAKEQTKRQIDILLLYRKDDELFGKCSTSNLVKSPVKIFSDSRYIDQSNQTSMFNIKSSEVSCINIQ